MKTNIIILLCAVVTLSVCTVSFISCSSSDDGDTTPPVIELLEPEEGEELLIGASVHFEMNVSDNEALASYKVDIHENMTNPHNHSRSEGGAEAYFAFQQVWSDIAGLKSKYVHHHDIVIPENAKPGNYHLVVYCVDAAGNESHVARNIVLSHDAEEHVHDGE